MNRRDFLKRFGLGALAATAVGTGILDVERLLWTPGAKRIFDLGATPPALDDLSWPEPVVHGRVLGAQGGNVVVTADWITKEALAVLERRLEGVRAVERYYHDRFKGDLAFLGGDQLARVHAWLSEGRDVRIFTARISGAPDLADEQRQLIDAWCLTHLSRTLPITNVKDYAMVELWDDRCVQVEPNTGRRLDGAA